jgi:hypothetical protein
MEPRQLTPSIAWLVAIALGVASRIAPGNLPGLAAWGVGAMALFLSMAATTTGIVLARAPAYRVTAAALVVVAIGGCFVAALPDAGDLSKVFVPYFFVVAIVAFRALVGRSRLTQWVAGVALFGWLPFAMLTCMGCPPRDPPDPTLPDVATHAAIVAAQLLAGVLEIAALTAHSASGAIARYR